MFIFMEREFVSWIEFIGKVKEGLYRYSRRLFFSKGFIFKILLVCLFVLEDWFVGMDFVLFGWGVLVFNK